MAERVRIERLGAGGDGVAETATGPLYVAGALPGEIVSVERAGRRAELLSVEEPSPDRAKPFCPYYDRCGGCVAQHMGPDLYAGWKHGKVADALAAAKVEIVPEPLLDAHGDGRRRITLHARRIEGALELGFMRRGSHELVPIEFCPITTPALKEAVPAARAIAGQLGATPKPLDVGVTATNGGLDVDLRGFGPIGTGQRQRLIAEAVRLDLARLSLHGDTLVENRPPSLAMGSASVVPRPGGFLQATALGESMLGGIVAEACGGARRVADLFAGSGPFTLRVAAKAEVHAVESDAASLRSLETAARAAAGLRRVTVETRDLFRRPLLPLELNRFEAVVLDPPRAGAEAQVRQLILSSVPAVIMVSCDPGTFSRDAATLGEGGFGLERVAVVDQFKWSAHVEMVGAFRRARARPRRR